MRAAGIALDVTEIVFCLAVVIFVFRRWKK